MAAVTRHTAKLLNQLDSVHTRLCNHLSKIAEIELESDAYRNQVYDWKSRDGSVTFTCWNCGEKITLEHRSLIWNTTCQRCQKDFLPDMDKDELFK